MNIEPFLQLALLVCLLANLFYARRNARMQAKLLEHDKDIYRRIRKLEER